MYMYVLLLFVFTALHRIYFIFHRDLSRLIQLENDAKAQNKGKWSKTASQNVCDIVSLCIKII